MGETAGYSRIQRDTAGNSGIQRDTMGYSGIQRDTAGYHKKKPEHGLPRPDFVLGIFPFPSVVNDALDFIFEFGGAVLFFVFTGGWQ